MVKAWLLGLWLLLVWHNGSADQARLWLDIPAGNKGTAVTVQLGRPLTLQLRYRGPASLDGIDTSAWEGAVALDRGYAVTEGDAQRLRLRLTPRRMGQLRLAPLQLGGAGTRPLVLAAGPALEDGQSLVPRWTVSDTAPWQRQEILAELALTLTPGRARVEVDNFHPAGFTVRALPRQQQLLPDGRQRLRFIWQLRPRQAGTQQLEPPRLRYIRDGVPRRRFHFPVTTLTIHDLPPYVTPTVPVGRLHGADRPDTAMLAEGIGAADLATALRRAGLPASAVPLVGAGATRSAARIDWRRARPTAAGVVYFDPTLGRLTALHPRPPAPVWWWAGGLLALAVLLALPLAWQRQRLWRWLQLLRYRWQLRRDLARAGDALALAAALLARPLPGTGHPPRTVPRWATAYRQLRGLADDRGEALQQLATSLDGTRFGHQPPAADTARRLRALL